MPMLRDRETWLTALCYWMIGAVLIVVSLDRLRAVSWPVIAMLVVAAAPASLLLVLYERRTEGERARRREALRAEGRVEEAAEQSTDSTFTWGKAWGASYLAIGSFLVIGGFVTLSWTAVFAGLYLCGWGAWRFHNYRRWQKAELEHRRTSAVRIASAAEGLSQAKWDRPGPDDGRPPEAPAHGNAD